MKSSRYRFAAAVYPFDDGCTILLLPSFAVLHCSFRGLSQLDHELKVLGAGIGAEDRIVMEELFGAAR
jgi:hypothetical protein